METAGGIKQALTLLGEKPFLVINGDIFIDNLPVLTLAYEQVSQGYADAFLWLVDNPEHHPQGDFAIEAQGQLRPKRSTATTYSGLGIYHPYLI